MLGEEDEFLVGRRRGRWYFARAVGCIGFRDPLGVAARSEDLVEEAGQLAPFGVRAAATNREGERLQTFQGLDLRLQFGDGTGGSGLVENFLLGGLDFVVRGVFQVLDILGVQGREGGRQDGRSLAAPVEHFQLA